MAATLTAPLRNEYESLFNSCVIPPGRAASVLSIVNRLQTNRARYELAASQSSVPWFFIAVIHNMESSQNFRKHLHNGDPLTARTVQVPAGRPKTGSPPFTWEDSATDALAMKGFGAKTDFSVAGLLFNLERYNGWGYRNNGHGVLSPYLWSFSNHYTSGKYVKDGVWSDTAVSEQCGAAVLLRRMAELAMIELNAVAASAPAGPAVPAYSLKKSKDPEVVALVLALQQWLNSFPNIFVKPDGAAGPLTSEAYRKVTGRYLPGDPRGK